MQELVMKCEVCLELLEEYLDGELAPQEATDIAAHLITCGDCAAVSAALSAEKEFFASYDRELAVPGSLWEQIAERTISESLLSEPSERNPLRAWINGLFVVPSFENSFAPGLALVVMALIVGAAYMSARRPAANEKIVTHVQTAPAPHLQNNGETGAKNAPEFVATATAANPRTRPKRPTTVKRVSSEQSDLVSADLGYQDIEDQDTAKHIEQTGNLLRSIRNFPVNDGDQEIDVSYDKALSRRLLNENIVLRRDAEMKAKFPTKTLLSDLEPFLLDIANLPDQAKPDEVRVIKERVQKTEIVAALLGY
jgi:Putative zinc-finger